MHFFTDKADTNEIVSILGHELGHWKMSHTLQGFVITQSYLLASFCAFGLAMELGESLRLSFGYSTSATLITLYLFFAVVRNGAVLVVALGIQNGQTTKTWHGAFDMRHMKPFSSPPRENGRKRSADCSIYPVSV